MPTDRFRQKYTPIDEKQKELVAAIKSAGTELESLYDEALKYVSSVSGSSPEAGRAIAIALTELEDSVMWAVKAATTSLS